MNNPNGNFITYDISKFTSTEFPVCGIHENQNAITLHGHCFYEVIFVTAGKLDLISCCGRSRLQRGSIVVIPEGGYHGFENTNHCQLVNLMFAPHRLPLQLLDLQNNSGYRQTFLIDHHVFEDQGGYPEILLEEEPFAELMVYVKELSKVEKQEWNGRQCLLMGLLMVILSKLSSYFQKFRRSTPLVPAELGRIMAYLHANYAAPLRLKALARMESMSENTLLRHFNRTFGVSPMKYLCSVRLGRAAELLLNSKQPISEIAERCGFVDASYFSRIFRQKLGISPLEYRKKREL